MENYGDWWRIVETRGELWREAIGESWRETSGELWRLVES